VEVAYAVVTPNYLGVLHNNDHVLGKVREHPLDILLLECIEQSVAQRAKFIVRRIFGWRSGILPCGQRRANRGSQHNRGNISNHTHLPLRFSMYD
jgi:hypothetical protein